MKTRNLIGLLFTLAVLTITGCGGGGGGAAGGASGSTVSGVASKGLIRNGHYQAFQVFSSQIPGKAKIHPTAPFTTGATDAAGNFSISIPATLAKDGLLVKFTDGTYRDEATGADKSLATEFPNGMRAAFGNMSGVVRRGDTLRGAVTPFTEMAVRKAEAAATVGATGLDDSATKAGNTSIAQAFGLGFDITRTVPLDPATTPPAGSTLDQKQYTVALGGLSTYQQGATGTLDAISTSLVGQIDGTNHLPPATTAAIDIADTNFANSGGNNTGTPALKPPTVSVAASKAVAISNGTDAVTVTATVTLSGAPLPGAAVSFAITSGAGGTLATLSGTTDANGLATTSLTGSVDGSSLVVTASAGGISASSAAVLFANPNKPGAVALGSSASIASTSGSGVTLTAAVSPVTVAGLPAGTIANGTVVTFAITSGTGTLSAASATTTGGIATVTLSSTTSNSVAVTASTAGINSNSTSVQFANPNAPAAVALSFTGSTSTSGGGVTLSAAVSTVPTIPGLPPGSIADGTAVTFTITSGTGTLSAITTTTGGVATANLSSATANTVTVTASAGGITSAPLSVAFVVQPVQATIVISTTGVPAGVRIGGIDVTLTLPNGVTVLRNPDPLDPNSAAPGKVTATGAAAGKDVTSNAGVSGQVRFAIATTAGFLGGEFVTVLADIAPGTFPTQAQFTAALNGAVINTTNVTIPGVGLSLTATFQ